MGNAPIGVLLLNLGGPDTLQAVKPFLYNLFSDRDIIKLGPAFLQKPIAKIISSFRSGKTQDAYKLIGGGSPILKITTDQAQALQRALKPYGDYRVFIGMRYWHPLIQDTLRNMSEEGIEEAIVLSLYPHYSIATTGSAVRELKKHLHTYPMKCIFTDDWYNHDLYIEALYDSLASAIKDKGKEIDILYSAHSLPVSFIEQGDPYVDHINETIRHVNALLVRNGYRFRAHLAYQSRSGPVKWLEPSTDEKIVELGSNGVKELIVVPVSFVSDHIETLYEIDILYKDLAAQHGIMLKRAESLNTAPKFIKVLKDIVLNNPVS
ncbi:ferrochelatase [bacterium]|nr:MAG: ferrochelatase [bacterium]